MLAFATPAELERWLATHHASERELWVRIFKKGSGRPSVTWGDCVIAALTWGWIDGHKRPLDEASFLQRLTPRRPKSSWSKKNREHAERLIAEGKMQPAGLAHVEAARGDGRWDRAYAGSAEMELPRDLLDAVQASSAAARRRFDDLDRATRYLIYYRLQTARSEATRAKRIRDLVDKLTRGQRI